MDLVGRLNAVKGTRAQLNPGRVRTTMSAAEGCAVVTGTSYLIPAHDHTHAIVLRLTFSYRMVLILVLRGNI